MDIKRPPKSKIKKKIRNAVMIVIGVAGIGGITYGLTKLKPAAPTLDRSTVIVERSNPQMEQQATDADFQVKAAEADEENLKVKLESDEMTQKAAIATINAQYSQARLQLDSDEELAKQGLVADLPLKISRVNVQDLAHRLKVEQERLAATSNSVTPHLNSQ